METMSELKTTKIIVQSILEKIPETRNSDSFLYLKVLERIASQKKEGFYLDRIPICEFLVHMDEWGFPPFESVRRTRQKVQAEFPHLAACERVNEFRAENEQDFRAFARG